MWGVWGWGGCCLPLSARGSFRPHGHCVHQLWDRICRPVWIGVSCDPVLFGVRCLGTPGLLSGIVGHLLGVFKPSGHGVSAETGSGDRLGSKSAVRVQPSPPQPNWVSTGQACPWLRLDPRYRHNSSQWCREALSICFTADSTSRHTDTATFTDLRTFVKTTSWL